MSDIAADDPLLLTDEIVPQPAMSPPPMVGQTRHKARYAGAAAGFFTAIMGTPLGDVLFAADMAQPFPTEWEVWVRIVAKTVLAIVVTYKLTEQVPNQPKLVQVKNL